jgi:predicted nucleic acid-binding protein
VSYLVDANVLSEATRPNPDPQILEWLRRHEADIVIDPVILGEIRFGILLRRRSARRERLEHWFNEGIGRIHCVPWNAATGMRWAQLLADLRGRGRAMPIKDSLIAATALTHGFPLATLNRRDFEPARVQLIDLTA